MFLQGFPISRNSLSIYWQFLLSQEMTTKARRRGFIICAFNFFPGKGFDTKILKLIMIRKKIQRKKFFRNSVSIISFESMN